MRELILASVAALVAAVLLIGWFWPPALWAFVVVAPMVVLTALDVLQNSHTIRKNFPLVGHMRYLLEKVRPGINQYFVESNLDGRPYSRNHRSVIYQRAKRELDTVPFGTQLDVYQTGYEWINHSLAPIEVEAGSDRVLIGGPQCTQPYSASILNISAMSYGSMSKNAILALNEGAKIGGFAHNTGEGGISPYHRQPGGDLVWQVGTSYFGCRDDQGRFSLERFIERATLPEVKMIEIKLSQGAKPGHGGILPAAKLTPEICEIRGVQPGKDVISPSAHSAFDSPIGLLQFVQTLREGSGGKPVGFKLCVGRKSEFLSIVKAMQKTGITPDFITVDGGEGGTGAAPIEFSDSVGTPLNDGLSFVHNALVVTELREHIRLIASGKVDTGFSMVTKFALGADACNAARAMMFALGCIQARLCNTNRCPTGITTQDPSLVKGLHAPTKAVRVAHYQEDTVKNFLDVVGIAGLKHPRELRPEHIIRRVSAYQTLDYSQIYPPFDLEEMNAPGATSAIARAWQAASAEHF